VTSRFANQLLKVILYDNENVIKVIKLEQTVSSKNSLDQSVSILGTESKTINVFSSHLVVQALKVKR
jgi:hypothetical protein